MNANPSFPFRRNDAGIWETCSFENSVEQGIIQTLLTGLGERPMFKQLGCRIKEIIFMNEDENRDTLATHYLQEACEIMEPNALFHSVSIKNENDEIHAYVSFGINEAVKMKDIKVQLV